MQCFALTGKRKSKQMVKGNIFLDKEGINVSNIQVPDRNNVLTEFYIMRERARINGDSFFYVNTKEFEDFNEKVWSSDDPYWEGVEQGIIASIQNDFITPILINDITEFDVKPEPRTHGGYGYYEHPVIGYVHNINTWEDWHYKWNLEHPDEPEADALHNGIWICFERVLAILSYELKKLKIPVHLNPQTIVNDFHEQKMKHLDARERISESKRIGAKICEANLYQHEVELEKLEADHGNKLAERVYSLKIGNKYQFLSIDKQHGMLELCDDKGDHQMEIRFDGTKNKDREVDHSLKCVKEWKKKYNK